MASFAENEAIDFGLRFCGFCERHFVEVQSVMVTDLLASILSLQRHEYLCPAS